MSSRREPWNIAVVLVAAALGAISQLACDSTNSSVRSESYDTVSSLTSAASSDSVEIVKHLIQRKRVLLDVLARPDRSGIQKYIHPAFYWSAHHTYVRASDKRVVQSPSLSSGQLFMLPPLTHLAQRPPNQFTVQLSSSTSATIHVSTCERFGRCFHMLSSRWTLTDGAWVATHMFGAALLPPQPHLMASGTGVTRSTSLARTAGDTVLLSDETPVHSRGGVLNQDLEIGLADGPAEYNFHGITELFITRDFSLLVLEAPLGGTPMLRQYTDRGEFVRDIGRAGRGPGEFLAPAGLGELPDGGIVVGDLAGQRILIFDQSGSPRTTRLISGYRYAYRAAEAVRVDDSGNIYVRIHVEEASGGGGRATALLRLNSDAFVQDTLDGPIVPRQHDVMRETCPTGRTVDVPIPYTPQSIWTLSPRGYFVAATSDRYAIDLHIPQQDAGPLHAGAWRPGNPITSIRRSVERVRIAEAERGALQRRTLETLRRCNASAQASSVIIPRVKPFFQSVQVAAEGTLWVWVHSPSMATASTPENDSRSSADMVGALAADVFEPHGRYLGRVIAPAESWIVAIRGRRAWGVYRDDEGVLRLRRFTLVWQ
ncbi:MAG TPA: hypothetical protein VMN60_14905 [Longimicrobiales bacterium]|nr:hypothetical protein [Longimicrobiales bacterium]